MNNNLLDIFQSRLQTMEGWCKFIKSPELIPSILEERYLQDEKEKIIYSGRVKEKIGEAYLPGIDFTAINSSERRKQMADAKIGITLCDGLIAETGTAVLLNHIAEPRALSLLPERHIVIAFSDQIFQTLDDCLKQITSNYHTDKLPSITLISGPSRSSDIEKSLIVGVHGPIEFGVVVIGG